MAKIYQLPTKLISQKSVKSDMIEVIDRLVANSTSYGRSQGFIIGNIFSGIVYLIIQYLMR